MSEMEEYPNVAAERLRESGHYNVIPLKPGEKVQAGSGGENGEIAQWKKEPCYKLIELTQNIGFQHGPSAGTWAVDCDHSTILKELFSDNEKLKEVPIVKTHKGNHLIFKIVPDDVAPGDITLVDGVVDKKVTEEKQKEDEENGVKVKKQYCASGREIRRIDIRVKGYTVAPPSVHSETGHHYVWLNECRKPPHLKWSDFLAVAKQCDFVVSSEIENEVQSHIKRDWGELLQGGWSLGSRRRNLRSFYAKARIKGWSAEEAAKKYKEINKTCNPPLEEKEVNYNIPSAERWFIDVAQPTLKKKGGLNGSEERADRSTEAAIELKSRLKAITTTSGEIYWYDGVGLYRSGAEVLL